MRFKILAITGLVLLGIIVYSVYSDPGNENVSDDNEGIIQRTEINNSSLFVTSRDLSGFEAITKPDEFTTDVKNDSKTNSLLEVDNNYVFEEIKFNNRIIDIPESCEDFEIVIVNLTKFRELASNGTLNLSFMGENYELKLQERETQNPSVSSYSGYIVGKPQSSAFFTVKNDSIDGCINVDFYTLSYGITATEEKYNGNIVHLVCRYFNEERSKELQKQYSIDPLEFFLSNRDKKTHEVSVELFDFYNQSIFKETYTIEPGEQIVSPKTKAELGIYRYEIILDNDFTCEQTVRADYSTEVCSSEHLHINVCGDPDNPLEMGISVA